MEFLYFLSEIRTELLDKLFSFFTFLGEEFIVIGLIGTLLWCVNKRFAYAIGISYFFSAIAVQGLKVACRIPRPWVIDPAFVPVEGSTLTATGFSFPSGHTQSATSIYGTLGMLFKKPIVKGIFFFIVAAIGFSRMYLGVHTPLDVIVSFLISIAFSYITIKFFLSSDADPAHTTICCLAMAMFGIIVFAYSFFLYKSDIIQLHYFDDCCKAIGGALGFSLGYFLEKNYINFCEKSDTLSFHAFKLLGGVTVIVILKSGLKILFGVSPFAHLARYFILILWAVAIWPFIFNFILKRRIIKN